MADYGGSNMCYTPTELVQQTSTATLDSFRYTCDVSETVGCSSYDASQSQANEGVACLCQWGSSQTDGRCAWPGSNAYENYFPALKRAIEGSDACHHMAFDFVLRTNLFNYDDLLTISPVSFSSWYKCINDTSLLNEFMT